jgi:hypothetical protein
VLRPPSDIFSVDTKLPKLPVLSVRNDSVFASIGSSSFASGENGAIFASGASAAGEAAATAAGLKFVGKSAANAVPSVTDERGAVLTVKLDIEVE